MKIRLLCAAFAACLCSQIFAQQPADSLLTARPAGDSLAADSSVLSKKNPRHHGFLWRAFSKNYPRPRTAALLSAVLPGAGQAYNRKWWKVPIAWGIMGGVGYATFDTRKTYFKLRDTYKSLVDDDPNTNPTEAPYNTFTPAGAKTYRDQFRGYTEKWFIVLGVSYLLVVTDAFVDAHLTHFDVSDNLSLRLKPSFQTAPGAPAFGLGLSFALQSPKFTRPPFQPTP